MAPKDSLFLFELVVEELKSYTICKEFCVTAEFGDIFKLLLRDPNMKAERTAKSSSKLKSNQKARSKLVSKRFTTEPKVEMEQAILFESNIHQLISNMKHYPIELSLFSKDNPEFKLGSTRIPWNSEFFDYLKELNSQLDICPLIITREHNVFDEYISRRMASVKLSIKLSPLRDKNWVPHIEDSFKEYPTTASISDSKWNSMEDTNNIKTIFSGKDKYETQKSSTYSGLNDKKTKLMKTTSQNEITEEINVQEDETWDLKKSLVHLVRSTTEIEKKRQIHLIRPRSFSSIDYQERKQTLNYIFGNISGPFSNQVYCVSYFTVEKDVQSEKASKSGSPNKVSTPGTPNKAVSSGSSTKNIDSKASINAKDSTKSASTPKDYFKFKLCDNDCENKDNVSLGGSMSELSIDLPEEAKKLINITKCKRVDCDHRKFREPQSPPDERILIDLKNLGKPCCITEKVENVVGGVTAQMKVGNDPCYCSCECTFGFVKKTTYCNVCGGYEVVGEEIISQKPGQLPFPCPIYHKLVDKNKMKTSVTSSDKKGDESQRTGKTGRPSSKMGSDKKSVESEKDSKKGKKKKDDRFKFNYGYQAPKIGHSQCAMPCSGTMDPVPKNMGWLWTADNVPGLKFRPNWKPGATNKKVVRLLKIARNPEQELAKRRKKEPTSKKRPLQRPLLIVNKKGGEYTVTMETMKMFNKPRAPNQHPFEDKDPITFTVGRTEEENRIRQKKKDRRARRLEREQRDFIQNSFRNICEEICLKTYQQALGLLPHSEDPDCTCYPAEPGPDDTNLDHSCSCSDTLSSMTSDTDSDEWVVEFNPPNAIFDPSYKGKKIHCMDHSNQYSYLDYKVKLLDRYGNPVPRFFKGPDGKEQCSDLGGFWSPDHKWLDINIDGFIASDGRWAPHNFIGPSGEQVDTDTGKFQDTSGQWLVIGVDGYIDSQGKWKYYIQPKKSLHRKRAWKPTGARDKKEYPKTSEATWSCFGDATPRQLSTIGIVGHGHDRKLLLTKLQQMLERGEEIMIPQPSMVPRAGRRKCNKSRSPGSPRSYYTERMKCKHVKPSTKGIVAVNERGHKTYFTVTDYKNVRPMERKATLGEHGISLSSFHVPCLSSFINSEAMRKQQYEHILQHNAKVMKNVAGQT